MDQEAAVTRIEQAIQSNKAQKTALLGYIQNLEAQLSSVDALISGAEAHMDVPDDMDSDEELPYTVSVPGAIIAVPPFTTEELEDEDSPFYKAAQRHIRYNDLTSSRNWTEAENTALKDAVQREAMRCHALQLQAQGFDAIAALQDVPMSNYGEAKENLDWIRVSRYVPNRLPSMCKVRWLAHEHPGVQRGPWTEAERMDLKRAVAEATRPLSPAGAETRTEEERDIDWEVVAGYMGNGRIASDCMKAYRSSFGKAVPTIWTPELDAALLEAVNRCGENNMTNVAMEMPIVLSRAQCAARYSTLKAPKAAGKWTPEENRQLQKLTEEFPETTKNRWALISGRMASRTGRQCRNHFYEILDQSVERGEWTEADDEIIQEAIRSSEKVDCKRLAEQLNRPVTMLRRRVNAFSKSSNSKEADRGQAKSIGRGRRSAASNPSRMSSVSPTRHLDDENINGDDLTANVQQDTIMRGTGSEGSGRVVDNLEMEVVMGRGDSYTNNESIIRNSNSRNGHL